MKQELKPGDYFIDSGENIIKVVKDGRHLMFISRPSLRSIEGSILDFLIITEHVYYMKIKNLLKNYLN